MILRKRFADILYDTDWPEVNADSQKMIIIMIKYSQQPMYHQSFGVVVLNLETFTRVSFTLFAIDSDP